MKPIHTIEDLKAAKPSEVAKALKMVTVKEDLFAYLLWLNSPQGTQTEGKFKLGYRTRKLGIHPSTIAKDDVCPYKLYLDVTGEIKPDRKFDMGSQLIFDMGTMIHAMLQMHFLNMYDGAFEEEVWLSKKRLLINSSHTDGRFSFKPLRFLIEIKTIKEGGNFGFAKVQDRPFPDNVRQLQTYMRMDDCPFGLLFYFCKNTGDIKEHAVIYDGELWGKIKKKTVLPIVNAVNENDPPAPKTGWHCKRCDYFHGCKYGKGHFNDGRFAKRRLSRGAVLPGG